MQISKIIFNGSPGEEDLRNLRRGLKRAVILVDMESEARTTADIPELADKLEEALPGILRSPESELQHLCGSEKERDTSPFKEEIDAGTGLCHLLEHMVIYMLGRRMGRCGGFTGQRSEDIDAGITTYHYVVVEYDNKLEVIVAVELAWQLLLAWLQNRRVRLNRDLLLHSIEKRLLPMLPPYKVKTA